MISWIKLVEIFLWGSTSDRQKMHPVNWNKIVKSKEGGLGIQAARVKNIALPSKLNWMMYHEQDANWAKIMLKKYCTGPRARASNPDSLPSSPNWRAIKVGFPILMKGVCWGLGDGSRVKIWADSWIRGESLRELIEGPLNQGDLDLTIADLRHKGIWNWDGFSFVIPEDIKDKNRAIPFRIYIGAGDFIMWKFSKDGEFSVKSAYQMAR